MAPHNNALRLTQPYPVLASALVACCLASACNDAEEPCTNKVIQTLPAKDGEHYAYLFGQYSSGRVLPGHGPCGSAGTTRRRSRDPLPSSRRHAMNGAVER